MPEQRPTLMVWRPIETAPKDGRRVIVCARGAVATAYWNTDPHIWERENKACWTVFEPDDFFYAIHLLDDSTPSHWMPLPEPPA